MGSDCDEKTIIERGWLGEEVMSNSEDCHLELKPVMTTSSTSSSHIFGNDKCPMFDSMTSNMTSSGCTTYASSGTDGDSVFVIGDEIGEFELLRILCFILKFQILAISKFVHCRELTKKLHLPVTLSKKVLECLRKSLRQFVPH